MSARTIERYDGTVNAGWGEFAIDCGVDSQPAGREEFDLNGARVGP